MPPTQHMQMNMADCLPAIRTGVGDNAEPSRQRLPGDCRSGLQQMSQQRIPRLRHIRKVLLRNRQQVRRSLRIYIGKHKAEVVFVDDLHRNLMRGDLAEDAVTHAQIIIPNYFLKNFGSAPGTHGS
jgi:hypothetical protein